MKDVAKQLTDISQVVARRLAEMQLVTTSGRLKEPGSAVTQADEMSHALLRDMLERRLPGIPLVMEEQSNPEKLPSSYIAVDELDGTSIYMHGLDDWALTLALIVNGEPVAGVMNQPRKERVAMTWKGGGSSINGRPIVFNSAASLEEGIMLLEWNRHLSDDNTAWLRRIVNHCLAARGLACAVGCAMELLAGHAVCYLNCRGGKVWDFAAAALAVKEAGGVALDELGMELNWRNTRMGVLFAADQAIANQVLALR